MYWLCSFLSIILLSTGSILLAQKPTVSIVVWDGKSKEGHELGEIRIYQLGEPTPGLNVKLMKQCHVID